MQLYIERISQKIVEVARKENSRLLNIASFNNPEVGIFQMPELAFAYLCGKEIMLSSKEIFGEDIPKWERELNLGNGGPTDLLFTFKDGGRIAIEFKMRDTGDAYIGDVDKLSNIQDSNVVKIFCAVIDVFVKDDLCSDGRIDKIEQDRRTEKLALESFKTNQSWYQREVCGVLGIWKVNPV